MRHLIPGLLAVLLALPGAARADDAGLAEAVISEATALFTEDVALCAAMAAHGAALIQDGEGLLTHCNTGGLATAGVGTALGVIRRAHEQGKRIHVFVDETRPLLQGGRLTTWELRRLGVPYTLISDSMAALILRDGRAQRVLVGADRIAKNGDFANKVGTYALAVVSAHHRVPFHPVAPWTTVDLACADGAADPSSATSSSTSALTPSGANPSRVRCHARTATSHTVSETSQLAAGTGPAGVNVYTPAASTAPPQVSAPSRLQIALGPSRSSTTAAYWYGTSSVAVGPATLGMVGPSLTAVMVTVVVWVTHCSGAPPSHTVTLTSQLAAGTGPTGVIV